MQGHYSCFSSRMTSWLGWRPRTTHHPPQPSAVKLKVHGAGCYSLASLLFLNSTLYSIDVGLGEDERTKTITAHVYKRLDYVSRFYQILHISLYLLIGDFFMIWRLIKDFKSGIVFNAGFDYDVDIIYIYIYIVQSRICRKFITNVPRVHIIASQTMGKGYFETLQSLPLTNIVITLWFLLETIDVLKH